MSPQPATLPSTPSPPLRGADAHAAVEPVAAIEPRSGHGRPEAAIAPFAVIALLAVAFVVGELMRGDAKALEFVAAALVAVACGLGGTAVWARERSGTRSPVADPRAYAAAGVVLTLLLVGAAAFSRGLASPYLAAVVLAAAYLGLILPSRLSAIAVGLMTTALVPLAILGPPVTWLQALIIFVLVPAGRGFGLLCGAAHRRAERVARQLTRADRLTYTLSRQGFLEEVGHALAALRRAKAPVALFLVDLDGFKEINTARGGAGGDELLAWCGQRLAEILPKGSSAGRLGGDEFGIATVGMNRLEADRFAVAVRDAIGERHPVSIGVATSEDSTVTVSDLLRVGNAALRRAKDDGERRIHGLVAGGVRPDPSARVPERPVLTYEALRRNGGRPRRPTPSVLVGKFLSLGLFGLGLTGAVVAAAIVFGDAAPPSIWATILKFGWIPWVLACLATGYASRSVDPMNMRHVTVLITMATLLACGGIGAAALAQGGGVLEPIMAGLALRVLFDTSVAFKPQALLTLAGTLVFYLAVVLLGPHASLWGAPFHLVLLASAYALGQVAQQGFIATTSQWLSIARTDVLTGLRNRLGVEERVAEILERASISGERVAIVSLDIDEMRAFNDEHGHAAGDAAIQRTAAVLTTTFSASLTTGRLGADEFMAAVPVLSPSDADRLTATIEAVLRPEIAASAGVAVFPDHGRDLDGLLHVADVRRRAAKAARRERDTRGERAGGPDRASGAA